MPAQITRRTMMAAGASALAIGATQGAFAQAKPKMRFSARSPKPIFAPRATRPSPRR